MIAALLLAIAVSQVWASAVPHPVRIFYGQGQKVVVRKVGARTLSKSWTAIRSTPPHRQLNPEHRTFIFEGRELAPLLRSSGVERANYVYAVGSDDYVSMIPATLIRDHRTVLAFKKNGELLTRSMGEQQIIFPTEAYEPAPVPSPYAQKAAFWNWYVRALVIGDLPNSFSVRGRQNLVHPNSRAPQISYVPPSIFSHERRECPHVTQVSLTELGATGAPLEAKLLSGAARPIPAPFKFHVLAAYGKTAIPVECGGPFILVKSGKTLEQGRHRPDDLVYFVYGVDRPR